MRTYLHIDHELRVAYDTSKPYSMRIAALKIAQRGADDYLSGLVAEFREQGATWEEIGRAAGVTKQAAQKRWG